MRNVTKVVLGLLICSFVSCTSFGNITDSMNLTAGPGESEIIIKRSSAQSGSARDLIIIIDGQPALTLKNGSSGKIIVKNGEHILYAELASLKTRSVEFTAESNRITFLILPQITFDTAVLLVQKESEFALSPASE